ncbi:MbnP family protein [Riemerella columbina]|uniref:MbnP family protein n=1 Tax=Riemerella columbina TaxID=103810 RepID=UPI00266F1596|nr:MbnP family protein [Riemerella columbina]WKS95743.1 hypothetical protein NYR17_03110 [Riemerella columbina]
MKKYMMLWVAIASLFVISCNRDSEPEIKSNEHNNLTLKFENIYNQQAMAGLSGTYTSKAGQTFKFQTLKYIISDVTLIKSDGSEFKYHHLDPDQGAYIIDQSEASTTHNFVLKDIPAGDYKAVRFGLGIAPEAFVLGENKQATFWDKAKKAGMGWSWASGYKFVNLEGVYGQDLSQHFKIHIGNIGNPEVSKTPNVYKIVQLDLPQTAKVRQEIAPKIHIMADVYQALSGKHSITLSPDNHEGMHPSKTIVQQVSENLAEMFHVDHVHND